MLTGYEEFEGELYVKETTYGAVSYTHLDVYKRQILAVSLKRKWELRLRPGGRTDGKKKNKLAVKGIVIHIGRSPPQTTVSGNGRKPGLR